MIIPYVPREGSHSVWSHSPLFLGVSELSVSLLFLFSGADVVGSCGADVVGSCGAEVVGCGLSGAGCSWLFAAAKASICKLKLAKRSSPKTSK